MFSSNKQTPTVAIWGDDVYWNHQYALIFVAEKVPEAVYIASHCIYHWNHLIEYEWWCRCTLTLFTVTFSPSFFDSKGDIVTFCDLCNFQFGWILILCQFSQPQFLTLFLFIYLYLYSLNILWNRIFFSHCDRSKGPLIWYVFSSFPASHRGHFFRGVIKVGISLTICINCRGGADDTESWNELSVFGVIDEWMDGEQQWYW